MIKLNDSAYAWGRKLIFDGQVDKSQDWKLDQAALLASCNNDWDTYGKWFLGINDEHPKHTLNHWVCPIGQNGKVGQYALLHAFLGADDDVDVHASKLSDLINETKLNLTLNDDNEILFYGVLGWDDEAKDMIKLMNDAAKMQDRITLRINSPGGDLSQGLAMYNYMMSFHKPIDVFIDGVAASAASLIACGGNINMPESTIFHMHNPISVAWGDYRDLAKGAEVLEKFRNSVALPYARKSGRSLSDIRQWFDDETYFTADEAFEAGFCDQVIGVTAQMNTNYINCLRGGNKMPKKLEKVKNVLTGLKLTVDDNNLQMIADAVIDDSQEEVKTLKATIKALGKTNVMTELTGRIGETPATMMGKVHDLLPEENFNAVVSLIENLQATINELGGATGNKDTPPMIASDEVIEGKIAKIVEDDKVSRSEALNILAKREPELMANWR